MSDLAIKAFGALSAGITGMIGLGSVKANMPVWKNEADVLDQQALFDYRVYQEKVRYTGNAFLNPLVAQVSRPDLLLKHKLRRAAIYAKGFVRDVIWENLVPLAIGTIATFSSFGWSLSKAIGFTAKTTGKSIYSVGKGIATVGRAVGSQLPKSNFGLLQRLQTGSPKATIGLAATAVLGLVVAPYMLIKAATGYNAKHEANNFLNHKLL